MNDILEDLRTFRFEGEGYNVKNVYGKKAYLLGVDGEGNITFLIKPDQKSDAVSTNSSRGKHLDIFFNTDCVVSLDGKSSREEFTILVLKTSNEFFEAIFLNVCSDLIDMLGDSPGFAEVVKAVEALRELFRKSSRKTSVSELGLWGELFLIDIAKDKELLVESWHLDPKDTFDFNDGNSKLEVKTTTRSERVHVVKLNQIRRAKETGSLICSLMTSEIENGKSVKDLYDSIFKSLGHDHKLKLTEKLMSVAASKLDSFNTKYDYRTADMTKLFFDARDIPSIRNEHIDPAISEIGYSVSLEHISSVEPAITPVSLLRAVSS